MSRTAKNGSSLSVTIFLVFLILKLTGTITWSWWWVTCPLWIGFALFLGWVFIMLLIVTSVVIFGSMLSNKNNKF